MLWKYGSIKKIKKSVHDIFLKKERKYTPYKENFEGGTEKYYINKMYLVLYVHKMNTGCG